MAGAIDLIVKHTPTNSGCVFAWRIEDLGLCVYPPGGRAVRVLFVLSGIIFGLPYMPVAGGHTFHYKLALAHTSQIFVPVLLGRCSCNDILLDALR